MGLGTADDRETGGLAHVATASFLASRAAPSIGFWIALAGGVALARSGQRRGPRVGYGASIAAMLQTVAIIGPARFAVPLTQALSAPLLGVMESRGRGTMAQVGACAAIRFAHNLVTAAFAIVVLTGGVGAYTDSYDAIVERLDFLLGFLPQGTTAALVLTGVALVAWTAFASVVQVVVYRRGMAHWPHQQPMPGEGRPEPAEQVVSARRFDPRAAALASGIAFVLLLSGTSWVLLGSVAAWLALAWLVARGDRSVVPAGVAFALLIGGGVLVFTAIGGIGLDQAAQRGARAALLVLVATWLRAAAGSDGLREVSRRVLGRGRRVPAVGEAAGVMDQLGSGGQLGRAGREAAAALSGVKARPRPVVDAALGWVEAEARRFRPAPPAIPAVLHVAVADYVLVALAIAPLAIVLSTG
jgi:hypothetical protein